MRQLKITKSITNRETESLDKYLQDIGKEELITADEEVQLAQKIKSGDKTALEKLVKANLRFVVSVAKQYQNQGLSLPDLINEGNLGLIKAAQRFDETRGFKFISYAVWWIRQSILQALAEQSRIVRLPLNQVGSLNKIAKEISKLEYQKNFFTKIYPKSGLLDILDNLDLERLEYGRNSHQARGRGIQRVSREHGASPEGADRIQVQRHKKKIQDSECRMEFWKELPHADSRDRAGRDRRNYD